MSRFKNSAPALRPEAPRTIAAVAPTVPAAAPWRPPAFRQRSSATAAADEAVEEGGILGKIGFGAALAYAFLRFGLLNDAAANILNINPHLNYVLAPVALLAMLLTGGLFRAIRSNPGRFLCGFFLWLLAATPFSVWKGGSADVLLTAFEADFSMFFMIAGLTTTWYRLRLMLLAIAAGGVCDFILCVLYPSTLEDRLILSFGTLSNPNDLATHLLFTLPICVWCFLAARRISAAKFLMPVAIAGILIVVLRTGSRSGLLALLCLTAYLILRGSVSLKLASAVSLMLLTVGTFLLIPPDVRSRYFSMLGSHSDAPQTELEARHALEASGSSAARQALLRNSLNETLQNPLFGVGPGQFAVAEAEVAKAVGRRAAWNVTHNAYTQISAEAGIPAFLCFVGALLGSIRMLVSIQKRTAAAGVTYLSLAAFWMGVAAIGLSINMFFSALGYSFYVPTIVALAVSAGSIADRVASAQPAPARAKS